MAMDGRAITCTRIPLLRSIGDTGKMRWYFQFTPHDTHDWDAGHVPVLIDAEVNGRARHLIVNANRNGFYYVLDRVTGEFLKGQAYGKQTWAKGLDAKGRPIVLPNTEPSEKGSFVWPNANGATIWFSPSYDPARHWIYVPVRKRAATYFKRAMPYRPGRYFPGGGENETPEIDASGEVRAMDALTGDLRWSFPAALAGELRLCWRPQADWCSREPSRATSSRSTRRPAGRCGTCRRAPSSTQTR